jgi:MoaA/NifB/PqqE/SkfB family radical SAM enzyme
MYKYNDIKTVHLEITAKCQAACLQCDRNINGGDINPNINLDELSLEDCKKIFQPEFVKQLDSLFMCGNLGDPVVAKDSLEVMEYLRSANPNIWLSMNTNAGAKKPEWWRELAKVIGRKGHVIFSLDGLKDTNHLYRQNVNWDICMDSAQAFIDAGGRARWDYLIFGHNQHQVEEAEALSKRMGFEKFMSKKTGRFFSNVKAQGKEEHQGVNRKGEETQKLTKPDEKYINTALKKVDPLVEKYGSMNNYYDQAHINCKVLKDMNIYVSASGHLMPCCWVAGQLYKWWEKPGENQIYRFIDTVGGLDELSVLKHGFKKVLEGDFFDNIKSSWKKDSCSNGKLKICSVKCGTEFDPFGEQFA